VVLVGLWKSAGNVNCKFEGNTGSELVVVRVNGYGDGGYFSIRKEMRQRWWLV